jgi:hypothetical protein
MDVPDSTLPGPSWHRDPLLVESRLRWWAGDHWTAWVTDSPLAEPGIAWRPELSELPAPIQWGRSALRIAEAPPLSIRALPELEARAAPPEAAPAPPAVPTAAAPRPRRRRHLVLVAAVLPLLIAGAAGAALLTPSPPRPVLAEVTPYRDASARFSLFYPRSWRTNSVIAGQGVSFLVAPTRAPADQLATVSLIIGAARGPRPSSAELQQTATNDLRPQYPGIRLTSSTDITLAGSPATLLTFDAGALPITTIEQLIGRTTDGRTLTVTITVHDPRHAPAQSDLHDFLASITA